MKTNAILLKQHSGSGYEIFKGKSNLLIPPVYIHASSQVQNSIIGPNVAIGKNCSIRNSIITNSIVDDGSNIATVALENSLIGIGRSVNGNLEQLILADHDEKR